MSTESIAWPSTPVESRSFVDRLHEWIATVDHKRLGILYMIYALVFLMIAGIEATVIRLQLMRAHNDFVSPQVFNRMFTMHGTTMIFFVVMPLLFGFATYLVPLMIGARDMAFPRLNALSFWLLAFGGVVFYATLFFQPPEAGWWSYPPLSSALYSPSGGQDAWIFLIHITGISSLVGAINFYATIVNMRAPGMTWGRLPLFVWSLLVYALL